MTLDNNVIDGSMCGTSTTRQPPAAYHPTPAPPGRHPRCRSQPRRPCPSGAPTDAPGRHPTPARRHATPPPASHSTVPTRKGRATLTRPKPRPPASCNAGFTATVRGREIKRVVFSDRRQVARQPDRFAVPGPRSAGVRRQAVFSRHDVTFKDATRARTLTLRYRACAAAVVHPLPAPSTFTG